MNSKLWRSFVVIFVVWIVLDVVVHSAILGTAYQSEEMMKVWRPDMMGKMYITYINTFVMAFFFTLIYSKWYKRGTITEGVQYGVYIGFLMATPMAYSSYAMFPIPYSIAMQWFIYGMIHYIVVGIVASLMFGKKEPVPLTQ